MMLVTGAGGFVGGATCDTLRARGIPFIGAVRRNAQQGQVAIGDITATTDWSAVLRGCDVVLHLAARVHVMDDAHKDPLAAYREANVAATMNLARQAVAHGVKRFVFVSSIKVNGEESFGKPFTAFDVPAPLDPYGLSKLEAELALQEWSRSSGLELVIVRPPLVYGPGVRANFLKLMQLVKRGVPLPLGAVPNRRSMVALDNLVDLLIACSSHPEAPGKIFLVSDGQDASVTELIRMMAAAMHKKPLLVPVPAGLMHAVAAILGKSAVAGRLLGSLQVDIGHTKSTLGWKPVAGMQESVDKTVACFLAQHGRPVK